MIFFCGYSQWAKGISQLPNKMSFPMSFMSMTTLKNASVLAACIYGLTVLGVEELVAKTVRGATGPVFAMNGVDLPRALGPIAVAFGAESIRSLIL